MEKFSVKKPFTILVAVIMVLVVKDFGQGGS